MPSEEKLEQLKKISEEEKSVHDDVLNKLTVINNEIKNQLDSIENDKLEKIKDINGIDINDIQYNEENLKILNDNIIVIGKSLAKEIDALNEKIKEIDKVIEGKNNDENFLKTLMENQQLLDKKYNEELLKYQNIQTEMEKEKALLLEIKEILPKDIESENQLDNEIKIIENKIVKVEKDLKDALDLLTNIQKSVAETIQNNRSLEKWTDIYNNKNNEFNLALSKNGFESYEKYSESKINEEEINILDKTIQSYYQKLRSKNDQLQILSGELEGKTIINVDEIHNKLKDKEKELNEYNIENKKLYSRISNNKDTLKYIEKITDKIKDDENHYNVIGELSELANGNNVERITFERYVLAAYFDDIIKAAQKIMGLNIGADDYVTKPFRPLELLARVNSHLRRYSRFLNMVKHEEENTNVFEVGGLELNTDTREVILDGKSIRMTPSEFKILELLIRNPGRVFSAEEIYERVWNEQAINTDTIMVHVRNIREKIEINPKEPKYLKVVWGIGYKIEKQ